MMLSTHQEILNRLVSYGLDVSELNLTGRLTRCKAEGDKSGQQSGWYVLYELSTQSGKLYIVGAFGNWKDSSCPESGWKLKPKNIEVFTNSERKEIESKQQVLRETIEKEKKILSGNTAKRAEKIFNQLPEIGKSEYLQNKKIKGYGIRFSRGAIIVPVGNWDGALVGLQFIYGNGKKKFLTGTAKKGAFHLIGEISDENPILVAEGYSTAASIHEATNLPVIVAFDAGNLKTVSIELRKRYQKSYIVICGDDDHETK